MRRRALLLWAALPALAQAEVEANTATRAELESLPGLGKAAMARKLSAAGLRVAGQPFSTAGSEAG